MYRYTSWFPLWIISLPVCAAAFLSTSPGSFMGKTYNKAYACGSTIPVDRQTVVTRSGDLCSCFLSHCFVVQFTCILPLEQTGRRAALLHSPVNSVCSVLLSAVCGGIAVEGSHLPKTGMIFLFKNVYIYVCLREGQGTGHCLQTRQRKPMRKREEL